MYIVYCIPIFIQRQEEVYYKVKRQPVFSTVIDQTLRHKVLDLIRNAILTGKLAAGEPLPENEIAKQMGVSRMPVREAMRDLEHEGLLISHPHRGTVVATVDEDEVDQLYLLRAELEGFTVRSLMEKNTPGIVTKLQQLLKDMEASASKGNLTVLAEKDLEYHWTIVSSSGYQILARVWRSMDGPIRVRLYRAITGVYREDLIRYTANSHQLPTDAIASGNIERAVAAIKTHIIETRTVIEKGLNNE